MRVTVKKWGNSAAVRIPVSVLRETQLAVDDAVEVRGEDGHILIEPVASRQPDVDALIRDITPDNVHDAVDFGLPVGRESL